MQLAGSFPFAERGLLIHATKAGAHRSSVAGCQVVRLVDVRF